MIEYVVGFAFYRDQVLLQHKLKPEWQQGKLNGPGGKIEPYRVLLQPELTCPGHSSGDLNPEAAMRREFHEECGILVGEWYKMVELMHREWTVHFFKTTLNSEQKRQVYSPTPEENAWYPINYLPLNVIDNLRWIIPFSYYAELSNVPIRVRQT